METKNNLPTFRTLYMVMGILNLIFSIFPLIYVFIGATISTVLRHSPSQQDNQLPFDPGIFFIVIGLVLFLFIITLGILNLTVAKSLKETRNYNFIFGMAIVNCTIGGVLGILLGVFTLVELNKPYVKELFDKNKQTV